MKVVFYCQSLLKIQGILFILQFLVTTYYNIILVHHEIL